MAPITRNIQSRRIQYNTNEAEKVLGRRTLNKRVYYLVKWRGMEHPLWHRAKSLNCKKLISEFLTQPAGVEAIIEMRNVLILRLRLLNNNSVMIPAEKGYEEFPDLVFRFYENCLTWDVVAPREKMMKESDNILRKIRLLPTYKDVVPYLSAEMKEGPHAFIFGALNTSEGIMFVMKWNLEDNNLTDDMNSNEFSSDVDNESICSDSSFVDVETCDSDDEHKSSNDFIKSAKEKIEKNGYNSSFIINADNDANNEEKKPQRSAYACVRAPVCYKYLPKLVFQYLERSFVWKQKKLNN